MSTIKKKGGFIVPRNPLPMSYKGYEIKDPKASYSNSKKGTALNTTVQIFKNYGMRSVMQKQKNYRTDIVGDKERAIKLAMRWIDERPENQKKSEFLHQDEANRQLSEMMLVIMYELFPAIDADRIISVKRHNEIKAEIVITYKTEKETLKQGILIV